MLEREEKSENLKSWCQHLRIRITIPKQVCVPWCSLHRWSQWSHLSMCHSWKKVAWLRRGDYLSESPRYSISQSVQDKNMKFGKSSTTRKKIGMCSYLTYTKEIKTIWDIKCTSIDACTWYISRHRGAKYLDESQVTMILDAWWGKKNDVPPLHEIEIYIEWLYFQIYV